MWKPSQASPRQWTVSLQCGLPCIVTVLFYSDRLSDLWLVTYTGTTDSLVSTMWNKLTRSAVRPFSTAGCNTLPLTPVQSFHSTSLRTKGPALSAVLEVSTSSIGTTIMLWQDDSVRGPLTPKHISCELTQC